MGPAFIRKGLKEKTTLINSYSLLQPACIPNSKVLKVGQRQSTQKPEVFGTTACLAFLCTQMAPDVLMYLCLH